MSIPTFSILVGPPSIAWRLNGVNHIFGVVYGATGGHDDTEAAQKTDDIVQVLMKELEAHRHTPCCLIGDFNCEPPRPPHLARHATEPRLDRCGSGRLHLGRGRSSTDLLSIKCKGKDQEGRCICKLGHAAGGSEV